MLIRSRAIHQPMLFSVCSLGSLASSTLCGVSLDKHRPRSPLATLFNEKLVLRVILFYRNCRLLDLWKQIVFYVFFCLSRLGYPTAINSCSVMESGSNMGYLNFADRTVSGKTLARNVSPASEQRFAILFFSRTLDQIETRAIHDNMDYTSNLWGTLHPWILLEDQRRFLDILASYSKDFNQKLRTSACQ